MKQTITKNEYMQVIGLLTVAKVHNDALEDIRKSLEELTGEEEFGHCSDAAYGAISARALLSNLGI